MKALPAVHKVQKAHTNDPFVIVGVSADRDERAWRAFTSKNGMILPPAVIQYWHAERGLTLRR